MDKHDLVAVVKELALELGRTPTRGEFEARTKGGAYHLRRQFNTYSVLLTAAGLETYDERRSGKKDKIGREVWFKDIEAHLAEYQPKEYKPRPEPYPSLAIISDIHWPFECQRVVDKFYAYVEHAKPEWVIINGDAWDMYSHSKYPRSQNIFTPEEEERLARERNVTFWAEIKKRSPDSKCVQMLGNHDVRPLKLSLDKLPTMTHWINKAFTELMTFDGVKTMFDAREELYLADDIIVFHGYRSKLGDHRDYTLLNCFNGHTHLGGVVFRQLRSEVIFECNSGVAGDPMAKGLTYTPQKITHWTPGFAVMDEWGPRFVPA